jgi:hypothetical protein
MNQKITFIFLAIVCVVISGCRSPEIQQSDSSIDTPEGGEIPSLPFSAKQRLLRALQAERLENLNELTYLNGDPCLLGVDGYFLTTWGGGIYGSYILAKPFDDSTWENATVYGWTEREITYENAVGDIVTRDVTNLSELFSLPSWAMSAAMYEIHDNVLKQGPPELRDQNLGVVVRPSDK